MKCDRILTGKPELSLRNYLKIKVKKRFRTILHLYYIAFNDV